MKSLYTDFKKFISRGNIVDLAIALVIGGAFKEIINSLAGDIITPVLSLFLGTEGFENYKYVITEANPAAGITENAILYGVFLQNIIDFVLIAFVIFLAIKFVNKANEKANEIESKVENIIGDVKPKMDDLIVDIKDLLVISESKDDKEWFLPNKYDIIKV